MVRILTFNLGRFEWDWGWGWGERIITSSAFSYYHRVYKLKRCGRMEQGEQGGSMVW